MLKRYLGNLFSIYPRPSRDEFAYLAIDLFYNFNDKSKFLFYSLF